MSIVKKFLVLAFYDGSGGKGYCGQHLPAPSAEGLAAISTLFRECSGCWKSPTSSPAAARLVNALGDAVFAEPRVALLGNDSAAYGNVNFTILCSLFATEQGMLEYVNCGYTGNVTASAMVDEDDMCSFVTPRDDTSSITRIFGPNNATVSFELQEVSGVNFPQRYSEEYNATEMLTIRVMRRRVLVGGRAFPGLIQGYDKVRLKADLRAHCGNLSR